VLLHWIPQPAFEQQLPPQGRDSETEVFFLAFLGLALMDLRLERP